MDVGLNVDFDGKKNTVLEGDVFKEYPIGGMACEYARLHPTEIKPLILENSYFQDMELKENGAHALLELYEACLAKFGVIAAVMILTDFSNYMADFKRANEEELKGLIDPLNADKDTNQIKSFILKESGYDEFGIIIISLCQISTMVSYRNHRACFFAPKPCVAGFWAFCFLGQASRRTVRYGCRFWKTHTLCGIA